MSDAPEEKDGELMKLFDPAATSVCEPRTLRRITTVSRVVSRWGHNDVAGEHGNKEQVERQGSQEEIPPSSAPLVIKKAGDKRMVQEFFAFRSYLKN